MKISKQIKNKIIATYKYEGVYYAPSHSDLIQHLKNDKVSDSIYHGFENNGYEIDFEETLICLFFSDESVLVVNCNGGITSV